MNPSVVISIWSISNCWCLRCSWLLRLGKWSSLTWKNIVHTVWPKATINYRFRLMWRINKWITKETVDRRNPAPVEVGSLFHVFLFFLHPRGFSRRMSSINRRALEISSVFDLRTIWWSCTTTLILGLDTIRVLQTIKGPMMRVLSKQPFKRYSSYWIISPVRGENKTSLKCVLLFRKLIDPPNKPSLQIKTQGSSIWWQVCASIRRSLALDQATTIEFNRCRIKRCTRWWFQIFLFSSLFGEMIQCD